MKKWTLPLLIAAASTLYLTLQSYKSVDQAPREKLGATINSEYQEVRPLISTDGSTLYFSRRNHPENTGGVKDFQDIWVSYLVDDQWSDPQPLPEPLNNKKANTLCSINGSSSYAILLDSYKRVKTAAAQVKDTPAGWGAPDDLEIENFINLSSYYDFFHHEKSEVLLMAIDDGSGQGEQDLHVSFRTKYGNYSTPVNLGKTINTRKADFAPFLAADGKTLYFSSFGHKGMGGSDYFVSYRIDESWKNWTEPKNLGAGINSKDDENYLSVTGDYSYVYFESYPEGSKAKDIYRAPLPEAFRPSSLMPESEEEQPLVLNENIDTNTPDEGPGSPLLDQEPRNNSAVASTFIKERELRKTATTASKTAAYNSTSSLDNLTSKQYLEDGKMKSRILGNNYFAYNSYKLSKDCIKQLAEISQLMQSNVSFEAHLSGHADSWGTYESNMRISYLRAQAAAHFLIDQGVNESRLHVLGEGDQFPLASNDDEKEGRELNRRVEITLISPVGVYLNYTLK